MRSERLTIRLPGELAASVRKHAAEAGLPPATMARLFMERAILRGDGANVSERLSSLESTVTELRNALDTVVDGVMKIAGGNGQ